MSKEKITIAYISHDKNVNEKYLKPNLENLNGDFDVISIDDKFKPAENYNILIEKSKTKYILFVHEDTTFSSDLLGRINTTIDLKPDFGAIGIVGTTQDGKYHWGELDTIKEVQRLDGCCILINKEHNLKFDSETFV